MFGRILPRFVAFTLSVLVFSFIVAAQDLDDVTVGGKVTDTNGLPVVGATITATSVETGDSRTVTTNDDGEYRILKLKPGTYKIKVLQGGFGTQETPAITTISAQNVLQNFKLAPADVTAETTITVTEDDGPPVDTSRTIVGGTITEREIEEIPNNSRNALDLVLTLGGTSEEQLSTSGLAEDRLQSPSNAPLEQGNFAISGGTAYSNNLTVDGLDNNDDRSSRDRFQPSLESIAEVQVIANQFSAEYGRASGGRVNIRTRSGSNKFRGRIFGFFRDESLNANTWYNNSRNIRRPPLQDINPGFTFSGPLVLPFGEGSKKWYDGHNKTFFSIAYEHDKLADTTLIDAYIPIDPNPHYTLPSPTGTQQYCDTTGSPAPPCPLLPSGLPGSGPVSAYNKFYQTPNKSDVFSARVDTKITDSNSFTFGYQFQKKNNRRTTGATVTKLENAFQAKNANTEAFNFTDNHVFGARAVNQVRVQYSSYRPSFEAPNPFDPVVIVAYRDPIANTVRSLVMGNSTVSSGSNFPDTRDETRWQFQDSMTYLTGKHSLKFGFDMQNVVSKVTGLGDATGTFNFGSVLDYTNNKLSQYRQNFGTAQDVKNKYYGVFFNDEMKPWSGVTVSAGLRYERETAVTDKNNFGPRLGVAWSPFKSGKGVVRAGAGIFYNRALLRTIGDYLQNSGGTLVGFNSNNIGASTSDLRQLAVEAAISTTFPNSFATPDALRAVVLAACLTVPVAQRLAPCSDTLGFNIGNLSSAGNPLRSVDPNLKIPESYQFNVGFEREIFKGWVFEANYTWNKTAHLWRDTNANIPVLPAGYADWTAYLLTHTYSLLNTNGTTRTYSFALGAAGDTVGVGTCNFATTNTCVVNLNSTSAGTTAPGAATAGVDGNNRGDPIPIALAAIAQFRPDQTVAETSRIKSIGNAKYQGLILELRSRYRKLGGGFGASFRFAYTLSKTMDDGLNNTANAEIDGDYSRDWARTLQDRRHRIAFSGTFDFPKWLGKLKFSPLFRYGSSAPFNLGAGSNVDRNLDDLSTDRVNFSGNISDIRWRAPGSPIPTALINQFSLQPIGSKSGNLPRNSGTGPSFFTFDLNVSREFKFSEHAKFRPVLEVNNILNAAVFSFGSAFINSALTVAAQTNFLVPTRTYRPREIRLGFRFDF